MFDDSLPEIPVLGELSARELVDAAQGWARAENAACARKLAVMAEIFARRSELPAGERELWWIDPDAAVAAELAAALDVTRGLALAQTYRGVTLRDRLPRVASLFEAGLIRDLLVRAIVWRTDLIEDQAALAAVDAELAAQKRDEPDDTDTGIEYLGADAELDQVIFDGSSFGTATPAGSDEEADFLGIPGLLDAAAMRDLLRQRQEAQLTKRTASGEVPRPSTHGQLRDLRKELNTLVSLAHHRTGMSHGQIHNELRRICGGPPVAAATSDQLKARIVAVRQLSQQSG